MKVIARLSSIIIVFSACLAFCSAEESTRLVGAARVDITPNYPIRLSGYGNRREVFTNVVQHIFAKALAIGDDTEEPAVLVTVDNCGVPYTIRDEVVRRLAAKTKVKDGHIAISSSHTHCAPMLVGVLPNLFSMDIPAEHVLAIERYTRELTDKIEQVALAALADRKPARLAWGVGQVGFAANRRVSFPFKPTDHDLPVLRVTGPDGKVRAIFTSYACHCTTLSFNNIHGDWAGCAQEALEREFPGAIVLTALGCGADQNPQPRGTVELAVQHGAELAVEAKRLVSGKLKPVTGKLDCRAKRIELPFDKLPTREEWEKLAQDKRQQIAYHAKKNLARLDRGETLPTQLPYFVQTWAFGDGLAMVFLAGEVVVDYSLRIKREFDTKRVWVNGYSNDVPCYIPSKRVLDEGGYEGATAMVYYDRPTKFAPEVEELIFSAVHELMPKEFVSPDAGKMPAALSPAEALASIRTKPGFTVDLAVAEPLVVDPAAIDWGADGKLWVVEMCDYPMGMDGNYKPGGRIKVLTSSKGDGHYDKATVFLDGLPFPTGVTAWRRGALISAAPDIIYAEDTDGDGRADIVKKLFTGFETNNYQARVNSLSLGLDNWIHGANGLLGGKIHSFSSAAEVNISGRDFRMNPDTSAFEPATGVTQQGRCRDDWDNWFGCNNSAFIFQLALPDHYIRRNPHVSAPASRVYLTADADPSRVYPASRALERFNNPESLNHVTSGCGLGLYRDTLLGEDFYGDAFTCEPVHNLVHRLKLTPKGVTFDARRAADEQTSEFFASTDNWCRPVQARTGPDGALWIVDMYRYVIEHPRWIPADKLAKLDVRAGADKGRIYRVYPMGAKLRPVRDLTKLATPDLVAALDTPNGTVRDLVHMTLLNRGDKAAVEPLKALMRTSQLPAVRLQAMCALDGLRSLTPELLLQALGDSHPAVRRHAVRLCEGLLATSPALADACVKLANDSDIGVRYQLAFSLGEWDDARAAKALGAVAQTARSDSWLQSAVLSSATRRPLDVLDAVMTAGENSAARGELVGGLLATVAAKAAKPEDLGRLLKIIAPAPGAEVEAWQVVGLLYLQDALDRRKIGVATFLTSADAGVRAAAEQLKRVYDAAHRFVTNKYTVPTRLAALRLFGRGFNSPEKDLPLLKRYIGPTASPEFQKTALEILSRSGSGQVPELVLADWAKHGPSTRIAVIDVLLGREVWTQALLDAVEKGALAPVDVPAASRQRLASHDNAKIRQRAAALFPARESRAAVIAKYQVVANLRGDAVKGAAVYLKNCTPCHAYLGQGHDAGPNVNTFRNKTVQDFIIAILDPNAVVEPRFTAYNIETKDDRSLTGVISSETATTIVLSQPGGVRVNILRSDIESLRASGLSLMPEGFEQGISPQDLVDLIAYLKTGM